MGPFFVPSFFSFFLLSQFESIKLTHLNPAGHTHTLTTRLFPDTFALLCAHALPRSIFHNLTLKVKGNVGGLSVHDCRLRVSGKDAVSIHPYKRKDAPVLLCGAKCRHGSQLLSGRF